MSRSGDMISAAVGGLALCWRLARPDGVVLGFTSHDRDILRDGVVYRAGPGMTPSAVVQTDELAGDSMAVEGVLASSAITAADLAAGVWTGAVVEVLVADWSDPDAELLCLSRGRMGEVVRLGIGAGDGGPFQVELLSELEMVEAVLPLRLSPTCRNSLGDGACGVNLDPFRLDWDVAGGIGNRLLLAPGIADPARFSGGRLRFIRGPLSGQDMEIVGADAGGLLLDTGVLPDGLVGARVRLTPGCDKRLATCHERFGNVRAFGGEPYVPGTDALLRYAQP